MIILPAKNSVSRKIMTGIRQLNWIKHVWLFAVVILTIGGCAEKRPPAGILSREEMVRALVKVYVTEQKVNKLSLDTDSSQIVFDRLEHRVFTDLGISDSLMKKSYNYYMDRPKELELIYTALVDTLNLYEQRGNLNRATPVSPR